MTVEYIRYRSCDPERRADVEKAAEVATVPEGGRRP